jgi:hypothetical protein
MPEAIKFRPDALPLNRRHLFATGLSVVIGSMVWPSYLVGREALITPLWARILRASIAAANDDSLDSRPIAFQFRPPDHFHEDPIAIGQIYPLA